MQSINLDSIPNQAFSIRLDNSIYDIKIQETNGVMCASITRDNTKLIDSVRILPNTLVIPYKYLEKGNFAVITSDDEYPNYTKFNITQFLYYLTNDESGEIRAGT